MSDNPIAVEIYRTPEVKTIVKTIAQNPRPNKILLNYIKASSSKSVRDHLEKTATDRPIDVLKTVAVNGVGALGAMGGLGLGYRVAQALSPASVPVRLAGGILGSLGGRMAAQAAADVAVQTGLDAMEDKGLIPEALTNVDPLSENQSEWSIRGAALGLSSAVPTALFALGSGRSFPVALSRGIVAAAIGRPVGGALGNVVGHILDRRAKRTE